MKRRIVLISFTSLNASGGVPRWNRDFVAGFPGTVHFSWDDCVKMNPSFANQNVAEWDKALILSSFLSWGKCITKDDIIIADGFWAEGFSSGGYNTISVAHGIWSHLTKEDVDAGKQPEFPLHNAVQVKHRKDHLSRGGKIVAVSRFIQEQMRLQWGFESSVINNAVDIDRFKPKIYDDSIARPLVIHGVTTVNKGFDHIEEVRKAIPDAVVLRLDDAAKKLGCDDKYDALAQANLVVQPSAYEGNSYFVLETMACGVPIVAYNVGLLHSIDAIAKENGIEACVGAIIDRKYRSPQETAKVTKFILQSVMRPHETYNPRKVAELFSIQKFHAEWRNYLEEYERFIESR